MHLFLRMNATDLKILLASVMLATSIIWSSLARSETAPVAVATTNGGHDHADIRRAAEQAVAAQLRSPDSRVRAVATEINSRLRLAVCSAPLTASLPYETGRKTRITAEVRCDGRESWKLYVPVQVEIWEQVLVAAGPLQRGQLLGPDDIRLAERTMASQARGYLLDPAHAVGYRLKRPLSEGDVITPAVLVAPPLIAQGQRVTLQARTGPLMVQMGGVALEDGLLGEIIAVENRESGRKVEGVVRSGKTVEVLLH